MENWGATPWQLYACILTDTGYHTTWGSCQDPTDTQTAYRILSKIQGQRGHVIAISIFLYCITIVLWQTEWQGGGIFGCGSLIGGGTCEIQANLLWIDVTPLMSHRVQHLYYYNFNLTIAVSPTNLSYSSIEYFSCRWCA